MSFLLIFIRKRLRFIYQLFIFKSMYINTLKNRKQQQGRDFSSNQIYQKSVSFPSLFHA